MTANPFALPRRTPFGVLERVAEWATGLSALQRYYQLRPAESDCDTFLRYTLDVLGIGYQVENNGVDSIPISGPTLVVANHPLGGVEGVILAHLLRTRRKDVKVLANNYLRRIPELASLFIGVDVFEGEGSRQANIRALRQAHSHLADGGLLLVFPAGEVSTVNDNGLLTDKDWSRSISALVRKHQSSVVPVYIGGRNSDKFYKAGKIHPLLRTLMLGREMLNKRGQTIPLSIGDTILSKELRSLESDRALVNYLRLNTYLLAKPDTPPSEVPVQREQLLVDSQPLALLEDDIAKLPKKDLMLSSGEFDVFCSPAENIPHVLSEIGRMRESNFRAVGEGTGLATDIDQYDDYYQHLFIWDREQRCLVGAYRLGRVDEIIAQYGIEGLYSRSLFKYDQRFFAKLGPAIEMGRSVIDIRYQRSLGALLLLWKGIATYVSREPGFTTLFGPVSISNDYPPHARRLLAETLSIHHYDQEQAALVEPTKPLATDNPVPWHISMLTALADLQLLSKVMGRMSAGMGVPVLLRQYLGLNGKLVCFNVDPAFNNALDGLIVVDLRKVPPRTLARYMGKEESLGYLEYHQAGR